MRRVTITLLLIAVTACVLASLSSAPWLYGLARVLLPATFAGALVAFLLGLPRTPPHVASRPGMAHDVGGTP